MKWKVLVWIPMEVMLLASCNKTDDGSVVQNSNGTTGKNRCTETDSSGKSTCLVGGQELTVTISQNKTDGMSLTSDSNKNFQMNIEGRIENLNCNSVLGLKHLSRMIFLTANSYRSESVNGARVTTNKLISKECFEENRLPPSSVIQTKKSAFTSNIVFSNKFGGKQNSSYSNTGNSSSGGVQNPGSGGVQNPGSGSESNSVPGTVPGTVPNEMSLMDSSGSANIEMSATLSGTIQLVGGANGLIGADEVRGACNEISENTDFKESWEQVTFPSFKEECAKLRGSPEPSSKQVTTPSIGAPAARPIQK